MLNKVPPLVFHVHQLFHVILPDFLKFLLSLSTLSFCNWHLKHHTSLLLFALQFSKIDNHHYWTLFSPMLVHHIATTVSTFFLISHYCLRSPVLSVVNSFADSKQTLYSIHCNSNIMTGPPGFWMSHFTLVYPDASPATDWSSSHPIFHFHDWSLMLSISFLQFYLGFDLFFIPSLFLREEVHHQKVMLTNNLFHRNNFDLIATVNK